MIKSYRYLIYKLYSWTLKKKGDTPIANVIITLSFVHYVQLFTFYMLILYFFPSISIFSKIDEFYVFLFLIVLFIAHYFLLYNKKRWNEYIEEYQNESHQACKRGTILVWAYLVGSILLFFALIPFLFR